jgi:chromosome segregation ATPase
MSDRFSLQRLSDYIAEITGQISSVRREVEQIQVGFNSAYVEWRARHDAALEQLVEAITARLEEAGPNASAEPSTRASRLSRRPELTPSGSLQSQAEALGEALHAGVEERVAEEGLIIAERRQELRENLIPEAQAEADSVLQEGQCLSDELRELNPRLDRREEELKAQLLTLEGELTQLNGQIRRLSGCLGVVFNFIKISRLGRQRQEVVGQLKVIQQELKRVREEWQETKAQIQAQQEALQGQWQALTLTAAQLQGELGYLDHDDSRESLALRRAVRHVVGSLKEPVACPTDDIKGQLDTMVKLNIQIDDYQEALGSVGSFMSVLDGIAEGLTRFNESVQGLIDEKGMHRSYLPELHISIPDDVLAFHGQWDNLTRKVHDESRLCSHPAEFLAIVRPAMEGNLSAPNIKAMFDDLGQALKRATSRWEG